MAVQGTTTHKPWVGKAASIVLVGLGIFLLKLCVFDVLAAAKRHETISLSMKGVLLAPPVLVLGLVATVASFTKGGSTSLGERFSDPHTRRLRPLGWAIVLLLLAVGGGVYFWLTSQLTALGYDV
jgi:hypothetical protein